jgi:ATP-dependent RNA helicase RhlE
VHRIGRTARAGADGVSVSFVAPDEKPYLRDIERLTRVQLIPLPLPESFLAEAARQPAPSRKPAEAAQDARREERDARGRGGPRQPRGGQSRPQNRDGQARDAAARNDRNRRPQGERGAAFNPVANEARGAVEHRQPRPEGDRRPRPEGAGAGEGQRRRFRRGGGGQGGFRGNASQAG